MAIELNPDTFDKHISSELALVDFWAPWCGPCQMLGPVINQLSEEMKDVKIGKVNVDENTELAEKYQVSALPTIILFKNAEIVDRRTGVAPASELKKWIEQNR